MYIRIVYTEIKSLDYKRMQLINIKLFHYNWNDNLLLITRGISGFLQSNLSIDKVQNLGNERR